MRRGGEKEKGEEERELAGTACQIHSRFHRFITPSHLTLNCLVVAQLEKDIYFKVVVLTSQRERELFLSDAAEINPLSPTLCYRHLFYPHSAQLTTPVGAYRTCLMAAALNRPV